MLTVEGLKERLRISNGCWLWTMCKGRRGYGLVYFEGRLQPAHRVSWKLHYGAIPAGLLVCHRCDNPPCCRPEHLFLGTVSDNAVDMSRKGRGRWGKLTPDAVRAIQATLNSGMSQLATARAFGVARSTIGGIASGRTWRWITGGDIKRPGVRGRWKLDDAKTAAIVAAKRTGERTASIAERFDIDESTVRRAVKLHS